jgi:hypothetical protein
MDPDVSVIAALMDARLADRELIARQSEQIRAMSAVIKAQQRAMCGLAGLLLAEEGGGGG